MSYKVLARKWRPSNFECMIGQSPVIKALQNSLSQDRLHHAYLFSGTRGVGKTTIARIFAKSISCELGVSAKACEKCDNCLSISAGNFVDLIEVDAASRTGVNETRELLENVQYLPNSGKYKIYLIDEVHMFSKSSFNALLKTLEEPPEHVIFLLATTEPEKLPATILSRCLQFNLSHVADDDIEQYFSKLLKSEDISFDAESLNLLAKAANGSVRDGLSLLDQAIAFGGGEVEVSSVRKMLGSVDNENVTNILHALLLGDLNNLLLVVEEVSKYLSDFSNLLDSIAVKLHNISVANILGDKNFAEFNFEPETLQLMYQIAIKSKQDLLIAPTPRIGLEMSLIRMLVFMPDFSAKKKLKKPFENIEDIEDVVSSSEVMKVSDLASNSDLVSLLKTNDWLGFIKHLDLKGLSMELAKNTLLEFYDDKNIVLSLIDTYRGIATDSAIKKLSLAVNKISGQELLLKINFVEKQQDITKATQDKINVKKNIIKAKKSIKENPHVADLINTFNAKVDMSSVKTVN